MVKALNRALLRDLKQHIGLIAAIGGVFSVGLACFVAMQDSHRIMRSARDDFYTRCRMADFWIRVESASESQIRHAAGAAGIAELQGRISLPVLVDLDDAQSSVNGILVSAPDERVRSLNDLILLQGDYFSDPSRNEAIVSDRFAKAHRLVVGSELTLTVNRRRERFVLVGTAVASEFAFLVGPGSLLPDPEAFGAFYVRRSLAERLANLEGAANEIVGKFVPAPGGGELGETARRASLALLEQRLDPTGVTRVTPLARQTSNEILESDLQGGTSMAAVVPTVFLVVGTLLINVFLRRMVRNRRTTIGTLKALGYADATLFVHFLKFGLVVGAAATIMGIVAGLAMAYGLVLVFDAYYQFPELPFVLHPTASVVAAILGIGSAASGAAFAASGVIRLAPAAAMRPAAPEVMRGGGVSSWAMWRWFPLQIRIGVRNALRSPGRATIGVFASAMGAALLFCGLMLTSSQDALVEIAFRKQERYDLEVVLEDVAPLDVLETFRRLPGVDRAEPKLDVAVEFLGRETREGVISGLSSDAMLTRLYDAERNEFRPPAEGVVLSTRLAEILGVKVGDSLRFRTLQGERREYVARVAAVAHTFLGTAAYARIESLAETLAAEPHLSSVQLSVATGTQERLKRTIADVPGVQSTVDRGRISELIEETLLRNQGVFVAVLVVFAGTIFFGGSLNAALVNLDERRRETATWRALGYDPWEIGFQFFIESASVQAVGVVLGSPLGYLLTVAAAEWAKTDVLRLPIVLDPGRLAWTLAAAAAFTLLAHAVVQRLIFRMNLLDSLKTRE